MAVWKALFLHEFPDGNPANLRAVPGELSVEPDGPQIRPTPAPADRGFLITSGRRLGYQLARPLQDVIGVDLKVELFVRPQPTGRTSIVSLAGGKVALALDGLSFAFVGAEGRGWAQLMFHVDGETMPFTIQFQPARIIRLHVRWHTHGQAQVWQDNVLRAYQPGFAARRAFDVERLDAGDLQLRSPPTTARLTVRRICLKVLRRQDAQNELRKLVAIDVSALPRTECAVRLGALQIEMLAEIRKFMSQVIPTLTRPWEEGEAVGPFSAAAVAAHRAALAAGRAIVAYLARPDEAAAESFLGAAGEFLNIMAAADPVRYRTLLDNLATPEHTPDPACLAELQPLYAANAQILDPIAELLEKTWKRAQDAAGGSHV